jgi:predicted nucleotidyltransferase component of viral defense system
MDARGHLLPEPTRRQALLKGDNALRKAYFDETRFSADLDFGLSGDIGEAVLLDEINKVCAWIATSTGVSFPTEQNKIKEKFAATDGPSATPNLKAYEVRVISMTSTARKLP